MDPELADVFYMKYVDGTNYTMPICTPHIPVRPEMRKKYAQMYPDRYSMTICYTVSYQPGFLKLLYQRSHWKYIFSADYPVDLRLYMVASVVVAIIGVFGE